MTPLAVMPCTVPFGSIVVIIVTPVAKRDHAPPILQLLLFDVRQFASFYCAPFIGCPD